MEDIRLPADVLTSVMSRAATGPRAACIAAMVSPAFRSAADSDTVWSRFLPADLAPLVYPSPPPRSKKELFLRLSGTHVLLEDGLTVCTPQRSSFSLSPFIDRSQTSDRRADPCARFCRAERVAA